MKWSFTEKLDIKWTFTQSFWKQVTLYPQVKIYPIRVNIKHSHACLDIDPLAVQV